MDQTDKAKLTLCAFTEAEEENNNKVRETEKKKKNLVFTLLAHFLSSESPRTARIGQNVQT